jgi:hypothetical protein
MLVSKQNKKTREKKTTYSPNDDKTLFGPDLKKPSSSHRHVLVVLWLLSKAVVVVAAHWCFVSSSSSWREAGGRQYHLIIVVSKKRYSYRKKTYKKPKRRLLGKLGFLPSFPSSFLSPRCRHWLIVVALVCLFKLLFCLLVVACDVVSQSALWHNIRENSDGGKC